MRKTAVKNEALFVKPRRNRVIVLESLNFFWDEWELNEIAKMWKSNFSVKYMADYFDRDPDEILPALIHLAKEERIIKRKCGLLGTE